MAIILAGLAITAGAVTIGLAYHNTFAQAWTILVS